MASLTRDVVVEASVRVLRARAAAFVAAATAGALALAAAIAPVAVVVGWLVWMAGVLVPPHRRGAAADRVNVLCQTVVLQVPRLGAVVRGRGRRRRGSVRTPPRVASSGSVGSGSSSPPRANAPLDTRAPSPTPRVPLAPLPARPASTGSLVAAAAAGARVAAARAAKAAAAASPTSPARSARAAAALLQCPT